MVLRRDARGVLAVGQASHAWLSGQMARAWGGERFGPAAPAEEVALGAEQHDVGMAAWDLEPRRNPETGLPVSFIEMDIEENLSLWRAGPSRLITQSRYAALLAAMHGRRLYGRRDLDAEAPETARLIAGFLAHSDALIARLRDSLGAPAGEIDRNSRLVWTWDSLSLALLLDWAPFTIGDVPTADGGAAKLHLAADGTLDPWPFAARRPLALHCEGRRLAGTSDSDEALHAALTQAPWETVRFQLQPAGAAPPTI
jgi:hypothetical protein